MKLIPSERQRELLATALLVAGVSLFHLRGILPGQTFIPVDLANNNLPWVQEWHPVQNWLISDPLYQFYPFLVNAVRSLRESGSWLLWNPRLLLGHPVIADPLMQPFYPVFTLLGLLFGAARGLALGLWLHAVLAAVMTYGFLRTIGCTVRAAILGGFTYALSGYLVTWFETPFWTSTLTWLPAILWCFELAIRRRRLRYAALAAVAMGLATLGGQFMFVVSFGLFFGLYAVGRSLEEIRTRRGDAGWPILVAGIVLLVGPLLGAIQLVPFAEFLPLTRRLVSAGLNDPLPWRQLVSMIVPYFYGNPTTAASFGWFWGEGNYAECTIYAGVIGFLLACCAPLAGRRFSTWYLFGLGIAALYFVIGGPGVQALGQVPVLMNASLHRSTFILPLIVATLAALGLSQPRLHGSAAIAVSVFCTLAVAWIWRENWRDVQSHWQDLRLPLAQAAALLAAGAFILVLRDHVPRIRYAADWCLVALVLVDLFLFGSRFNPTGPVAGLMPETAAIAYLREHAGIDRVLPLQSSEAVLFGPNVLSIYNISEASGYSSLLVKRLHQLVAAGDPVLDNPWMSRDYNMLTFSRPTRRLLDLLQVKYLVSQAPFQDPGIRAEQVDTACASDTGEISGVHPVGGSFTVRDTAINRVDVRLRLVGRDQPRGSLLFRLRRDSPQGQVVAEVRQPIDQATDRQDITLYFSPDREAPGRTYAWEMVPAEAGATGTGTTGVALCADAHGKPAISVYGAEGYQAYEGEVFIFERLSPLPRAYVVYAAEQVADDQKATALLLDESFDVRNKAVVAEPLPLPYTPAHPADRAEVVQYDDNRVVLTVHALLPGLLVLADQYHPGWHVAVDGRPASLVRANQVMRGVMLAPGDHQVVFTFAPASLRTGAWLTLGGLVLVAALAIADKAFRQRLH